jgi:uncharacterized protein
VIESMPSNDDRLIAAAIYVISFFTAFIGPLVIWLIKKNDSQFVDFHGREYLNFVISFFVYSIISGILTVIFIGFIMLAIVGVVTVVFTIIGAIKAYEGKEYRIPFIFRLL